MQNESSKRYFTANFCGLISQEHIRGTQSWNDYVNRYINNDDGTCFHQPIQHTWGDQNHRKY